MCSQLEPSNVPDSLNNALFNLSDKPTKSIGNTIANVLSVVENKSLCWSLERRLQNELNTIAFVKTLSSDLARIPIEKVMQPHLQILGSAVEDMTYCLESPELRRMFSSLIACSCNKDYETVVHPAFSATIRQLSPHDAKLLFSICPKGENSIEAVEYAVLYDDSASYDILHECILSTDDVFSNFDMQSLSASALKHLGLIVQDASEPSAPQSNFMECDYYKTKLEEYSSKPCRFVARRVQAHLTPYGEAFVKACVTSSSPQ